MSDRARRIAIPLAAFMFGLVALGVVAVLTLTPGGRDVAPLLRGRPLRADRPSRGAGHA